jgi:hypothetical protein
MPANNVNVEALRIVTYAAGKHRNFLEREIEKDESAVERAKEQLQLLETSIFMMEKHVERFDNEQ